MFDNVRQSFTLRGAPRTKKNHGIISTRGRFPIMLPSKEFSAWNRIVQPQLAAILAKSPLPLPITTPVNVAAHFYRERNVGDAVGFYQALADALEEGGIVENDRLIISWNGSRLLKDAIEPRIVVAISGAV